MLAIFFRNVWGIVQQPYSTYRKLTQESPVQLFPVFLCIGGYFFFISPLRLHTLHPFLLTLNAGKLFSFASFSFCLICLVLYCLGKFFNREVSLKSIITCWGFSLIPTLLWFFVTSMFYVILPPPRTTAPLGTLFSLLFISFSLSLLLWKGMLYYLTLRFALKLDLSRIILVSLIFFPLLIAYSWFLYRFGVFKVPFI